MAEVIGEEVVEVSRLAQGWALLRKPTDLAAEIEESNRQNRPARSYSRSMVMVDGLMPVEKL